MGLFRSNQEAYAETTIVTRVTEGASREDASGINIVREPQGPR